MHGAVNKTTAKAAEFGTQIKNNGRNSIILYNDNDESRKLVEFCYQKAHTTLNPIIDWTEEDVWEFLNDVAKVPHCELYDQGWYRLGCIGCPMATVHERQKAFEKWPIYKQNYIRAFERMIAATQQVYQEAREREQTGSSEAQSQTNSRRAKEYVRYNLQGEETGLWTDAKQAWDWWVST